jgi:hypothetical protein
VADKPLGWLPLLLLAIGFAVLETVTFGLLAYGLFCFVQARYREL